MKKYLIIAALCLMFVSLSYSQQEIVGKWEGKIILQGMEFDIVTDFAKSDTGYSGLIDVIQQGANDLPLQNISYSRHDVKFELATPASTAYFEGAFVTNDSISGVFKQSGFKGEFYLVAFKEKVQVEPEENLPYAVEEVSFINGDNYFAGTLTLPNYKGKHPAVVLITGSGAQTRDEDIFGFKIFKVIADHLTRNGIAVLRYDDRNTGESKGTPVNESTSEDFAEDVSKAVDFLLSRNDINPNQIGLLGHSEGGIIAPLVASKRNDLAFIVLMAGPSVPGKDVIVEQSRMIRKTAGESDEDIDDNIAYLNRVIKCVETNSGWEELKSDLKVDMKKGIEEMSEEERSKIEDVDEYINTNVNNFVKSFDSEWMKFFLYFDPASVLEKTRCPVLALFGGLDLQVLVSQNYEPMKKVLSERGNFDFEIKVFDKANHLFQEAETGSPSEYSQLKKEFIPGYLDYVTGWILKYVSQSR